MCVATARGRHVALLLLLFAEISWELSPDRQQLAVVESDHKGELSQQVGKFTEAADSHTVGAHVEAAATSSKRHLVKIVKRRKKDAIAKRKLSKHGKYARTFISDVYMPGSIAVLVKVRKRELGQLQKILLPSLLKYIRFNTTVTLLYDGDLSRLRQVVRQCYINAWDSVTEKGRFLELQYENVTKYLTPSEKDLQALGGQDTMLWHTPSEPDVDLRKISEFWVAHVYKVEGLQKFGHIWRLDTDSQILEPVTSDVFLIAGGQRFIFGYAVVETAQPDTCQGLQQAYESYLKMNNKTLRNPSALEFLKKFEARNCPHWNMNFAITDLQYLRFSHDYHQFAKYIIDNGILKHGWGDHLVLTLWLLTQELPEKMLCMRPWVPGYRQMAQGLNGTQMINCKAYANEPRLTDYQGRYFVMQDTLDDFIRSSALSVENGELQYRPDLTPDQALDPVTHYGLLCFGICTLIAAVGWYTWVHITTPLSSSRWLWMAAAKDFHGDASASLQKPPHFSGPVT
mmetsp:Transcript_120790/g.225827  ORF Transcript_120790/g.225827 Transcript_120790/m.225827 type:complete len:513 (-) Transcript_120790:19-1557(-)